MQLLLFVLPTSPSGFTSAFGYSSAHAIPFVTLLFTDNHQELIRPESDQLERTLKEADEIFEDGNVVC